MTAPKLPDAVERALDACDIYGDDAHGVVTPRDTLRAAIIAHLALVAQLNEVARALAALDRETKP